MCDEHVLIYRVTIVVREYVLLTLIRLFHHCMLLGLAANWAYNWKSNKARLRKFNFKIINKCL